MWPPGEAKWRKSASHHVRKCPGAPGEIRAAREGRSSEFLEAPEVPGDGSGGEISEFLDFAHATVFELETASGEPWGNFPGRPGSSRAILGNFGVARCFCVFEFRAYLKFPIADLTLA